MSEVAIVNSAFAKMGEFANERITSLTQGTPTANIANEQYPKIRDEMLRGHPWNFATARKQLARSARTPPFEFDYQYPIPSDFMRTLVVSDNTAGIDGVYYKMGHDSVDGRVFLTGAPQLYLTYVRRITDTGMMPPDFQEAMAFRLAAEFSIPLAQSSSLRDAMMREYRDALAAAKSIDGMEDYPDQMPDGSWADSRKGAYGQWWD